MHGLQRLDRLRQVGRESPQKAYPTDKIHVDRLNDRTRLLPRPWCQLADAPLDSLLRALRKEHFHLTAKRSPEGADPLTSPHRINR